MNKIEDLVKKLLSRGDLLSLRAQNTKSLWSFKNIALWLVPAVTYLLLMHFPWPTYGGGGLNLVSNLVVWGSICLWILALNGASSMPKILRAKKIIAFTLCGAIFLTIPMFWSPLLAWRLNSLPRFLYIWGLMFLFYIFLQQNLSFHKRRYFVALIALSGFIEAVMALFQLLFPLWSRQWLGYDIFAAEGRPLGALLQVNLLGSFLATALACVLWVQLQEKSQRNAQLWSFAGFVIVIALVLSHSRTGWLGAVLSVSGVMTFIRTTRRRVLMSVLFLTAGIIVGTTVLPHWQPHPVMQEVIASAHEVGPHASPANAHFNLNRMRQESNAWRLQMLRGALIQIRQHPWFGNGLGSFEVLYPTALASAGLIKLSPMTVNHPHNELLYTWAEGGMVPVIGLLMLASLWLIPLQKVNRRRYGGLCMLSLPIWLHLMTESPFALSAIHGVTLVLLLCLALPESAKRRSSHRLSARSHLALHSFTALLAAGGLLFILTGVQTQRLISQTEKIRFADARLLYPLNNPLAQSERIAFDRCASLLMSFTHTHDRRLLDVFVTEATKFLQAHNDANLIASLIQIYRATRQPALVNFWMLRGAQAFPTDPRFTTPGNRS